MGFLTIFTPTYNRGYILKGLYDSLCQQTDQDFCWLIVDDGSQDDTAELVRRWIVENKINIRYFYQRNSGKHVAHNHGVELCDTPLFFCVDSDDKLAQNAVEIIHSYWRADENNCDNFMGYCTKRYYGEPDVINFNGSCWPLENSLLYPDELGGKYHYKGETGLIWITKELKKYKFPVILGEHFVTEIVLYFQFQKPMKIKNDIFYFFIYQRDGYTKSGFKLQMNNPVGTAVGKKLESMFASSFFQQLKYEIKYQGWIQCFKIKQSMLKGIFQGLGFERKRQISWISLLIAYLLRYPCGHLYKKKVCKNDKQRKRA